MAAHEEFFPQARETVRMGCTGMIRIQTFK